MQRTPSPPPATPWGWAGAGALLGLLLALVLFAPAHWLASALATATRGQLSLQDARGTVWDGSAQLLLSGGAGSLDASTLPSRVEWRVRPRWLGAAVQLQTACCLAQPAQVTLLAHWGGSRVLVADSQSQWPADLLKGLGTPWNTLQPQGQLAVATQGLSIEWDAGRLVVAGSARVDALQMSSRLSTLKPMGSYRFVLSGGNVARVRLETLEGSLLLSGQGQWVGARLHFDGEASAVPERLDALSNLLNIIGRRQGARAIIKLG